MDTSASKARFISLDETISINLLPTFLGSVVSVATRPMRSQRPNFDDPDIKHNDKVLLLDMMKGLLVKKNGIELHDIKLVLNNASNTEARAHLTDMFKTYAKSATEEDVEINSGIAKRYDFTNPGPNITDKLMKSAAWKSQIKKMVREERKYTLLMVTGVLTCKDIQVSWKNKAERSAGLAATLPVTQALGDIDLTTASQRNPKVKFDVKRSNENEIFARIEDEVIFAVAYDYINITTCPVIDPSNMLTRLLGKLAFWRKVGEEDFNIKSIRLGKEARGRGVKVNLGGLRQSTAPVLIDLEKGADSPQDYEVCYLETEYESVDGDSLKEPEEA